MKRCQTTNRHSEFTHGKIITLFISHNVTTMKTIVKKRAQRQRDVENYITIEIMLSAIVLMTVRPLFELSHYEVKKEKTGLSCCKLERRG